MTKSEMKQYILKYQVDIDERLLDDEYGDIPYTEELLDEMDYKEMKAAFSRVIEAENETYKLYQEEVIRHGRSE